MEQQDLQQKDLIPFLGSKSKVSEVLAGKRPLTLSMIRALHRGLGIPAESLLRDALSRDLETQPLDWTKFPLREMAARGWIKATKSDLKTRGKELLEAFISRVDRT